MVDRIKSTDSISTAAAYRIHRLARLLKVHLSRWTQERLGVTQEQWFILFRLHERDGRTPSEMADEVLHDYPNITRLIDGLVKKGYVERRPNPDDRRKQNIFLTPVGKAQLAGALKEVTEVREDIYRDITAAEIEQMLLTMAKIERNAKRRLGMPTD